MTAWEECDVGDGDDDDGDEDDDDDSDFNELTASFACWFLVAKNISYCQYWKIEYISLDDIGADGRIFGSGISFNNTSLSDIGDQISRWLSTHFDGRYGKRFSVQQMWCL